MTNQKYNEVLANNEIFLIVQKSNDIVLSSDSNLFCIKGS